MKRTVLLVEDSHTIRHILKIYLLKLNLDFLDADRAEQGLKLLTPSDVQDDEHGHPTEGGVIAAEWFASGKRALLAPFGVGTVDQALLAALQVMHPRIEKTFAMQSNPKPYRAQFFLLR